MSRFSTVLAFWCVAAAWSLASSVFARDVFVVLSGGHSPWDNNYSQYLQARAMVDFFERSYPPESVWVFFGAGNISGKPAVFGDVHKQEPAGNVSVDSWLPGALPRNRPARRDLVRRAFVDEILPAIAGGGTLYLFVGDHGSQNRSMESVIDLWSWDRDPRSDHGWREDRNSTLSVSDLRGWLAKGMGKGRVVFCMTQCHSGGFHFLGVPRVVYPSAKWFTSVPSWARPSEGPALIRAAGFTATDEQSLAAGCMADPDPERWVGYERFIPEQLLGLNLLTSAVSGQALSSFADAHSAATIIDFTDDKPLSSSEIYLERWATVIEKLAQEKKVTPAMRGYLAAFKTQVDGASRHQADREYRKRQEIFRRRVEVLAGSNAALGETLSTGTRAELEEVMARRPGRRGGTNSPPPRSRRQNNRGDTDRLWKETVRPAWIAAINGGAVDNVTGTALSFEKALLRRENKGEDFFSGNGRGRLREEAFWQSGYSDPESMNESYARAIMGWAATRRAKIVAWARTSTNETVRAAGETLWPRISRQSNASTNVNRTMPSKVPAMSTRIAAERTLFYRRVLAAWAFLLDVNEREALKRLAELNELEQKALPKPDR